MEFSLEFELTHVIEGIRENEYILTGICERNATDIIDQFVFVMEVLTKVHALDGIMTEAERNKLGWLYHLAGNDIGKFKTELNRKFSEWRFSQ